jgi:Flp pilus assembly pilin Flp
MRHAPSRSSKGKNAERMGMSMTIHELYGSLRSQKGVGLVEYSLILGLVAVCVLATMRGLGTGVNATLTAINSNLP